MKLIKQLKTLNWGTPIRVVTPSEEVFVGNAKEAVRSQTLLEYFDVSLKDVKLVEEPSPHLRLILNIK